MKVKKSITIICSDKGIQKIIAVFLVFPLLFFAISAYAQSSEGEGIIRTTKTIGGTVSAISNNFIAVVYAENKEKGSEEEIALPIAKDVTLGHVKSLHQIEAGDRVEVQYEEAQKDGKVIERIAKVITFLGPAARGEKLLDYRKPVEKGDTMVWEEREKSNVAW